MAALFEKARQFLMRPPDHPRLRPSIEPMPADRVGNVMQWATQEFVLEGISRGLKGRKLDAYVKERVKAARAEAEKLFSSQG